jgi:mannose-6-phosphate isomerase-like protein (cupin superfamily)
LRSEYWTIIHGPVGIVLSNHQQIYNPGEKITIPFHTQHRLIGLDQPGIVAEIWIHNDQQNPSDEDDIIRLEDEYQRK